MDIYRKALKQLREESRRRIELSFNGTLDELSESLPTFVQMGFNAAILARTPPEDLTEMIRKLATETAREHNVT
jgi:hypothetical protein